MATSEYEMHYVLDDQDEIVTQFASYELAYKEAHTLANANDRVYRVRREKVRKVTKIAAVAVPLNKR
jgi:hypothetical protein